MFIQKISPPNASTAVVFNSKDDILLIVDNAASIASLTLPLTTGEGGVLRDGQEFGVTTRTDITTLNLVSGKTVYGGSTTLRAGMTAWWVFIESMDSWINKTTTTTNGAALTGLTSAQVGLGNCDNTSDANKPISTATQAALDTKLGVGTVANVVYSRVTGINATTTGQVLVTVTGLQQPLVANAVYEFEAVMSCSTSAVTTGISYGVNFSAAGATIEAHITGASSTTATKAERINAFNTNTTAFLATSAQAGGITIRGIITTGANAGDLTIQHRKITSGTSTVFINSFLRTIRIV